MGTIYFDTGGSATLNSGTTDGNSADVTLTVNAAYAGGTTIQINVNSGSIAALPTSGATQAAVIFNSATNTNQKIFWITGVDDVSSPKTITVSVAPTGLTAGTSTGGIGGRMIHTRANYEAAVRAGDVMIFNNTPASISGDFITVRAAGSAAAGFVTWMGKSGVRPVLQVTNTSVCINGANLAFTWFENLELAQNGASGNVTTAIGVSSVFNNVKISDGGAIGFTLANSGVRVIASECTGVLSDAVTANTTNVNVIGCYLHDNGGNGFASNSADPRSVLLNNIIDTNAGRGIIFSGSSTTTTHGALIAGNSIYTNGNSGIEITDADTLTIVINNILMNNGDAAGEYNVEWVAGVAEYPSFHAWNCFNSAAAGGSANLLNLTTNSTEITTDPLFTDAANGDFSLQAGSPARSAGYPGQFLGGSLGYMSMGAVQPSPAAKTANLLWGKLS